MTIVHSAFYLFLCLTGVHFRSELQHGGDVSQQKIKCRPVRTRERGGVYCQIYCMFHWTPLVTSGSFINSKMFFWKILSKVLPLFHNKILSSWLFSTNSVFSIFQKQKLIIVFWGLSLNKIVPASEAALKILKFFNGWILVLSNTTSVSSPKVKKGALTKRIYEICTSTVCPYA